MRVVELAPFLEQLCAKLQQSAPHHPLVLDAAEISVPADQAVPLGLLVTELVTNAFKYAYPDCTSGDVRVALQVSKADRLRLEISDDGVGLPADFDLNRPHGSLGMRLISTFARQLEGELTTSSAGDWRSVRPRHAD